MLNKNKKGWFYEEMYINFFDGNYIIDPIPIR